MKSTFSMILLCLIASGAFGQARTQYVADSLIKAGHYPGLYFSRYDTQHSTNQNITAGLADVENKVPMTEDHLLMSGSTGKTFVAAILMQLMQEGKLTPDMPVSNFLGNEAWFSRLPNGSDLTIRHLMQHQSGLARYVFKREFIEQVKTTPDRVWSPDELVAYILDDEPAFAPGETFAYSDTNYILLGMIIEIITGNDYYKELVNRLLEPLNLTDIVPTDTRNIKNLAQGYTGENDPLGFKSPMMENGVVKYNVQFEWTGGGLAFRTADYARWLSYLFEGKAFDMDQMRDTYFQRVDAKEVGGEYGMGFMILNLPGIGEVYGHAGFFPGYYTLGIYDPVARQAWAMQVNTTDGDQIKFFFRDFLALIRTMDE